MSWQNLCKTISKVLKLPTAYYYCESDELAGVIKKWHLRKQKTK